MKGKLQNPLYRGYHRPSRPGVGLCPLRLLRIKLKSIVTAKQFAKYFTDEKIENKITNYCE